MIPKNCSRAFAIGAAVAAVALAGACSSKSTAPANGTMVVQLTDAAFLIDSVARVDVFVVRVDGKMDDVDSATATKAVTDDSVSTGGWTTLATPNQSINLLAYQSGVTFAAGQRAIPAGTYKGFRLVIDPSKSTVTLKNGLVLSSISTPGVTFPSGSRSGIKVNLTNTVTVTADGTTTMLVDFDLANSFVLKGSTLAGNGLTFKPVIRGTMK